jgi:hypothetical protein
VKVRREMEAAFGRPNEAGNPSPGRPPTYRPAASPLR